MRKLRGFYDTVSPTSPDASTYAGLPEDQDEWTCAQWKSYYQRNKNSFGKQKAVAIFENDSNNIGFWSTGISCRYDCDFTNYMKGEGVTSISNIFSNIYCAGSNVAETAADITAPGTTKTVLWMVGIGAGLYFADKFGIFSIIKKSFK